MIKSAFQIPDHVAIRIFVYAPPRRKLSLNIGAGVRAPGCQKWPDFIFDRFFIGCVGGLRKNVKKRQKSFTASSTTFNAFTRS
jgi:hypothetical protein